MSLKYKISVITAVYNADKHISYLIESLKKQTYKEFEWIVVDGGSTDDTLNILRNVTELNIKVISEEDFGIYDALNKGVKLCDSDYYVVIGADDIFYPYALEIYSSYLDGDYGLITAKIKIGDNVSSPRFKSSWRYSQFTWVSSHAVGLVINKNLHKKYGFYSKKFPIAADQLFIKNCCQNGEKVKFIDEIVGKFGTSGMSSVDIIGTCLENYRIQLLTERKKWLITFIFILKLLRRLIN